MSSDEREISIDEVIANTLDKADSLNPEEPGFIDAYKALDIVLKNDNDAEKNAIEMEQIKANERIEMARIESEEKQHEAENALKDKEIKAAVIDSVLKSSVIAVVIGEVSYHLGVKVIGKFEETGTWRSLASKSWLGRLGKKK